MTPSERETLIDRYLDGCALPAEVDTLSRLLETDAAVRAVYLDRARLVAALRTDETLRETADETAQGKTIEYPSRLSVARGWLAAAAALVLTAAGWWWSARVPERPRPVMAEITAVRDAAWAGNADPLVVGARLAFGELRLARGELTVRLESGIRLEFIGPADAHFEHPMRLRLERGRLNADAGERGKGFTVVTSSGSIVDLGTRFAVDASAMDVAGVVVFSGQVQVQSASAEGQAPAARIGLVEGEAVHLRRGLAPERWQNVRLSPSSADALAGGEAIGRTLVEVHDNLTDAEVRRFYGVVRGGMGPGAPAFTGVPSTAWQAVPGQPFPVELVGADIVQTFLTDKRNVQFTLTLTLAEPGVVYVLHDLRKPPPAWLARDFADTGARIECGPWDPAVNLVASDAPQRDGRVFLACSVWRRTVPAAGAIVLGAPRDPGTTGRNMMYGVAVRPLSP